MATKTREKQINNNCYECAFFVKHYANLNGIFYLVGGCKHCINADFSLATRD